MTSAPVPTRVKNDAAKMRRRPRLRHVYYLLAVFDLLTVSLSLFVINHINDNFRESVNENLIWANRLGDYSELSRLAAEVNAPGNDVFDSRDVPRERASLSRALIAFNAKAETIRPDLIRRVEGDRADRLLEAFTAIDEAMLEMVGKAEGIFVALDDGEPAQAGESMAAMDRAYAVVNLNLGALGEEVRAIQQSIFDRQAQKADAVRKLEWLIAALMVLMVAGVTFYGNRLAVQVRRNAQRTDTLIAERTQQLEQSHQRLRLAERLASIGTLAAGLGHDMKNILFPVACRLDVLEEREDDATAQEEIASIRESLRYLQQLSDGLRLLSLDPDDSDATAHATQPAVWFSEVEPLLRTCLPRHAKLIGEIPEHSPRVAIAPHQLTQAVFNLVVNAGEATSEGGTVRVWSSEAPIDGMIQVGVSDDGEGMTAEVRRQALDPFFTTKTRSLSTGLGLALVHGLVNAAGGSVNIESKPGGGTTVTLSLPALPFTERDVTRGVPIAAALSMSNPRMTTFVAQLLRSRGVVVKSLDNGIGGEIDLWVCEAARVTPGAVRAFLNEQRGRATIVYGGTPAEWEGTGALLIDRQHGAEQLRGAIDAVLAERAG